MRIEGVLRKIVWRREDASLNDDPESADDLGAREWLVTNGLGGYASGTVCGAITRRFHGLLIAAMPSPLGRTMLLNHLVDRIRLSRGTGDSHALGSPDGTTQAPGSELALTEFRLDAGLPVWRYEGAGVTLEKRLLLRYRQNTTQVSYELLEGSAPVRLELEPWLHFRPHEGVVDAPIAGPYALTVIGDRYEIATEGMPTLRLHIAGAAAKFTIEREVRDVVYRIEKSRGYDASGDLWCPGLFTLDLPLGATVTLTASAESWTAIDALSPEEAERAEIERRRRLLIWAIPSVQKGPPAELVLATDAFVITPAGRLEDVARARAGGDDVRTVIAGYHWFTDWGRDTMISLEGLTLVTGRIAEAGYILRTFARYVKDGLIPNMFPEGNNAGLYHTADATLWFFHAVERYLVISGDHETLRLLLPVFEDIAAFHLRGTRFGIRVDPADGLLTQGAEGYQLTWMDAKVGQDVVTPRRGKAVELNALWFNALKLLERWSTEVRGAEAAAVWRAHAEQTQASFNRRFWIEEGAYLFDVIDGEHGDDASFRPNQIFSVSLDHPVLDPSRWAAVVDVVGRELLTPVGLRSLSPRSPDFKAKYFGDLRARDMAYHQGTVWAWLIGPFVDAYLRVHPNDRAGARALLQGFVPHLDQACVGQVSEIFDAEPPFTPRGCVAQAWSVAEVLRAWAKSEDDPTPGPGGAGARGQRR